MSSGKVGLAILGAGIFALEAHVPAILEAPNVEFKAVYSRSSRTATSFSLAPQVADLKLDVYSGDDGLEELLAREDIHAVTMALPISKQPELIEKCLKAGKHVLSEKPVAKDVATGKKLIELYESQYKSKGTIWRVAENWTHEPAVIKVAELINSPSSALGPVLFWDLKVVNHVQSGSKYHATEWRTVPDYQGGFLLDGGVHFVAALRLILGDAKPTQIIGHAALHRTHLGPHDTVTAIASTPNISNEPHGEDFPQPDLPLGKSTPTGTILITNASSRLPFPTLVYSFNCLNGAVRLTYRGRSYLVEVLTEDDKVKDYAGKLSQQGGEEIESRGVKEEVKQFAEAILGKGEGAEINRAEPRGALWDVTVLQALLTSEGKPVEIPAV